MLEQYIHAVCQLEQSQFSLPLIAFIMKYLSSKKQADLIGKHKVRHMSNVEHFVNKF